MELPHHCRNPSKFLFLLPHLLLLSSSCMFSFISAAEEDMQALLEWKKGITKDPSGLLATWVVAIAADPCSWTGVSCSPTEKRVVKLELADGSLSGRLCSDCLASLERLQFLDLSGNTLVGDLSSLAVSFLAHPCHLQSLNLSRTGLVGEIPSDFFASCSHIQELDLSVNSLHGDIPSTFFMNTGLRLLNLSHNQLIGKLPLTSNGHTYYSSLKLLDLSSNNISGPIPDSLLCFSSIVTLRLSLNAFSGPFPAIFSTNCSNTLIKTLDLSSNRLTGALPQSFCRTAGSALEELRLKNNQISGRIPSASLSNCTSLKILDLSYNRLEGKIPPDLALLSSLEILSMWYNNLSGPIPAEIGTMQKLRTIVLNNNMLSGRIPTELANCSSLEWLSLSGNRITGAIPVQFGQLERLTLLELAENSLTGELPRELGNCSYLLWLDVHGNRLSGPIHQRLGRYATGPPAISLLSGDNVAFIRHLGAECAGLGMLVEFGGMTEAALNTTPLVQSCAWVRLYDGPTLNDNPDYSTIQYVDLSRNRFSGGIPVELGHMRALQMLDLSRNDLVGSIPSTFAGLLHLGVLDLSHNRLKGNLWPLANCTFLVQVDVSFNNFSGTIPSVGQISTAPESNFAGNPLLCGPPLPACGLDPWLKTTGVTHGGKTASSSAISWQNNVILGVMIAAAFAGLLIAWAILATKSRKATAGFEANNTIMLGAVSGKSKLSSCQDGWNFSGGEKEPLSINVATFERPLRKLTFPQLIEATNGFSPESLIGTGGFGEVYKATLRDRSIVAVKKLVQCSYQGDREFIAEMETLGKIKHRNLVPLLGYCKVGEERLLVYEYMHGGSLEDLLHNEGEGEREGKDRLEWEVRKQIAKGAARGLAFLHHNCIPHIIHRDLKSSNVLLDYNLEARVSDFGMARLISALDTHLSVTALAGTPGYVPPEYYLSLRCTAKGDVYSFGVILLELLTGKRPTDKEEFGDTNLVGWVKLHLAHKKGLSVLDPYLTKEVSTSIPTTPTTTTRDPLALLDPHHTAEVTIANPTTPTITTRNQHDGAHGSHIYEMMQYLYLACDCLQDVASRRPTMLQVVARLKEISTEC